MKITEVTKVDDVYIVKKSPNWLESLFYKKETITKYKKDKYRVYLFNNGGIYYNQAGEELSIFSDTYNALKNFEHTF